MAAMDGTQSVARAFFVLRHVFSTDAEGARLSEIARALDLNTTTAFRLLKFLTAEGFLSYDAERKIYLAGPEIFRLAQIGAGSALRRSMRPVLEQIAERTGMATYLSIREGADSLCIDRVLGRSAVDVVPYTIGTRRALGIGAAGISLLATLSDTEIDRFITSRQAVYEPFAVTSETIWENIRTSRARGFVFYPGFSIKGIAVLGIPVETAGFGPVAISVLGFTAQFENATSQSDTVAVLRTAVQGARAWPAWPPRDELDPSPAP